MASASRRRGIRRKRARQSRRRARQVRPKVAATNEHGLVRYECFASWHNPGCREAADGERFDCGGVFTCECCGRLVGWCVGCADDYPEHCDPCAVREMKHAERMAELDSELAEIDQELKRLEGDDDHD